MDPVSQMKDCPYIQCVNIEESSQKNKKINSCILLQQLFWRLPARKTTRSRNTHMICTLKKKNKLFLQGII
jgi:hypothetical protein